MLKALSGLFGGTPLRVIILMAVGNMLMDIANQALARNDGWTLMGAIVGLAAVVWAREGLKT